MPDRPDPDDPGWVPPPFRDEAELRAWMERDGTRVGWNDKRPVPPGVIVPYVNDKGERLWCRAARSERVGDQEANALLTLLYPVRFEPAPARPCVTCPVCNRTSFHPIDVLEGYCAACSAWTTPRTGSPQS